MAKTKAQVNRAMRQEELRRYMQERGSAQYLFDLLEKAEQLSTSDENFSNELAKLKLSIDTRYKLLGKYMPEMKSVEVTGEGGDALSITVMNYARNNDTK